MEYYLGSILLLGFQFAPQGTLLCDGSLLPVTQYQALFSLLGTTFGGNGVSNFQLPDLRNASPIPGMKYYICTEGIYPSRQ